MLAIFYSTETACPSGYEDAIEDSDYCYKLSETAKDFTYAQNSCKEDGGTLIEIKNEEENAKLLKYYGNIVYGNNKFTLIDFMYIGLNKPQGKRQQNTF